MKPSSPVTQAEKRLTLDAVLQSETFARSDKLKQFLRYIGEMEIAGRAAEISEYAIGMEALGRPPGYSTSDDSIVRSTAYVLRQKLLELYEKELPDAQIRIELHKGSYIPVFAVPREPIEPSPPPPEHASPGKQRSNWLLLAGFLGAALAGALVALAIVHLRGGDKPDPIIAEAWGPLAHSDSDVLLFVGHPPHFLVRQYKEGEQPTDELIFPAPAEAYGWYRALQPMDAQTRLYMYATANSSLMGDSFAAVSGARTLSRLGVPFRIVPERTVRLPAIRGTNALLFGNPDYSPAVSALLAGGAYSVQYDPATKRDVIVDRKSARTYTPRLSPQNPIGEAYGLITVLTQAGSKDRPHRTIVVSGVNSAGTYAAMEFFSSADHLRQLKQRLSQEGLSGFPNSYQVLIKCSTETSIPISTSYEGHRLLDSNVFQP